MLLCKKGWYYDRLYGHESQFAGFFWPARCLAWQMHLFQHDQFPWLTVPKHSSSCQGGKTCTRPGIDPSICPQLSRNCLVRSSLDNCTFLKSVPCAWQSCVHSFSFLSFQSETSSINTMHLLRSQFVLLVPFKGKHETIAACSPKESEN